MNDAKKKILELLMEVEIEQKEELLKNLAVNIFKFDDMDKEIQDNIVEYIMEDRRNLIKIIFIGYTN